MEQQNQAILTRELSQPIAACVFSKDDYDEFKENLRALGIEIEEV